MRENIIKEFRLEGLDCANCAMKIEQKVAKVKGVSEVTVSFATKALRMNIDEERNEHEIVENVKGIIKKLEPHILVQEKEKEKQQCCPGHGHHHGHDHGDHRHYHDHGNLGHHHDHEDSLGNESTLLLKGLGCANCALKIEEQTRKIPGIKTVNIDLVSQKLRMEMEQSERKDEIFKEIKGIVKRLEPEVEVISLEAGASGLGGQGQFDLDAGMKKKIMRFGAAAVLFAAAILFELPPWAEFSLFFLSYCLSGGDVVLQAFRNIARGEIFDENFLMTIATIGAFIIGEYAEGVAVMLFYQAGEFFQSLAVNRSRKSIATLMDIRPDYANLKTAGGEKRVSPKDVAVGQLIVVKPGEKVPLDGIVVEGNSMVDTTALTGESVLREVEEGSNILGGFINKNGLLVVEVTKAFTESTVSKILELVENASSRKAPTENFITKFARYYTPVVTGVAALLAIVPPLVIDGAVFSDWFYRALIFLVISCPCALVISIPLSFFGGIGGASKNGILVKGSNYLEAMNHVETVIFDKTGTLTKGVFKVTEIKPIAGISQEGLLEYAAFAESYSNHPIAESILKRYGKAVNKDAIEKYEEFMGKGIKVLFRGKTILAGNPRLMEQEGIIYNQPQDPGTIVHVAVDGKYAGYLIIADEVKPDAARAIEGLKKIGVNKLVMLTGDSRAVGEKIAGELGLHEVYTELLPDQKVEQMERIEKQKSSKGKILFVGDGINDAPVLARADVGVAMGGLGSDAAIEAADVVLMTDEPTKLLTAIRVAKKTRRIVWQNITLALGVKLIVLALGAGGIATMWEAVFADVGVALLAVLNAIRVMKID